MDVQKNQRVMAWRITIKDGDTLTKVDMLGNDKDAVERVACIYFKGLPIKCKRMMSHDIVTGTLATGADNLPSHWESGYPQAQYDKGLEVGTEYDYIALSINSVWSAGKFTPVINEETNTVTGYDTGKDTIKSYERIGLHAHTHALFNGFVDSNTPILDFRFI